MSYKINLKELDPNDVYVTGNQMTIEEKTTGRVFLTDKKYMDKLFDKMGYRNLNVINILEEYANKRITEVADLKGFSIFVDETTDSFIVAQSDSVIWINNLINFLVIEDSVL